MSDQVEYRAVIRRDGRVYAHHYRFPKPDVEWGSYFHDIHAHEIVRWEKRTISEDDWKEVTE